MCLKHLFTTCSWLVPLLVGALAVALAARRLERSGPTAIGQSLSSIMHCARLVGFLEGGDGGLATDTGLRGPTGLAIDAGGNLLISDRSFPPASPL